MQLISRHQATRTWNEGSRKSSREKVEAGSRDRQDAVWFRPGTGTSDAIFIARQLQERYRGKHRELWWAFVDLEKAFDRVPRKVVE